MYDEVEEIYNKEDLTTIDIKPNGDIFIQEKLICNDVSIYEDLKRVSFSDLETSENLEMSVKGGGDYIQLYHGGNPFLEIRPKGVFYIKGELAKDHKSVVNALREWIDLVQSDLKHFSRVR